MLFPEKRSVGFLPGTPRPTPAPAQERCPMAVSFSRQTPSCRKQGPLDSTQLPLSLHSQTPAPESQGRNLRSSELVYARSGLFFCPSWTPFSLTSLFLSKPHTSAPDGLSHPLPTCPSDTGWRGLLQRQLGDVPPGSSPGSGSPWKSSEPTSWTLVEETSRGHPLGF